MSQAVLRIENVSKQYRLGLVGTGTLSHDLNRWWHLIRGKQDPYLKIGEVNDREKYGGDYVWALKDINFEVKQGEVLGIIGKNGAGKSTLLKLLSQVTNPTLGSIKVKGRIAALLEVGTGFHPELTGKENIFLNGAILGMTKVEIISKFDEIVDFSGVSKYIDTPVKRYSSGMMVRLGFAVAAHLEPEILVVDEVLAVGDAEFQKKCLGKMKDVAGQGRTVLFVSHNMSAVKDLCSRAILLEQGKMKMEGNVDDVVETYLKGDTDMAKTGLVSDDFVRNIGTGEAKIKQVEIINSQGISTTSLYFREAFKVRISFEVMIPLKEVLMSVRVGTHDGKIVAMTDSLSETGKPYNLQVGYHTVEISLNENTFMPLEFSLYVGIAHKNGGVSIDYIERVFDFTISKTSKEKKKHYLWTVASGFFEMKAKWQLVN